MVATLVYRKTLKIAVVDQGTANTILNVDAGRIGWLCVTFHRAWSVVIQISLVTFVLYYLIGPSCFVAVVIAALMAPLNYFAFKTLSSSSEKTMEWQDKRMKSITEFLQGMMIIKIFAWEKKTQESINKVRAEEIGQLKRFSYSLAMLNFALLVLTPIISVATFTVYALMGNKLEAEVVFPAIGLFNSLTWPILYVPEVISHFSQAKVSIGRIHKYLTLEESDNLDRELRGEKPEVKIINADFKWRKIEKFTIEEHPSIVESTVEMEEKSGKQDFSLQDIDFEAKEGQLIGIIGRVGTGEI